MICFLPKYANGDPHYTEKLPIWHDADDEEYDGRNINTPATELGRGNTPDTVAREKTLSSSIRSRNNGFDPEKALPQVESERCLKPARDPPTTSMLDLIPILRFFRWVGHELFKLGHHPPPRRRKRLNEYVESNVPLEIILVLSK